MKSKFFSSVFVTPSHPQQGQLLVTASFISLTGHIFFFLGGGGGGGGGTLVFFITALPTGWLHITLVEKKKEKKKKKKKIQFVS